MDVTRSLVCSRQGSYKLVESADQWHQQADQHHRRSRRSGSPTRSAVEIGGRRSSGYVNSGAETDAPETVVATGSMGRRNRRRQRYPFSLSAMLCFRQMYVL